MKQWDIFNYAFRQGDHPAIVLSPDVIAEDPDIEEVNVLFAATCRRITRPPKRHEVMLDESDGLDWKAAVRCHQLVLVRKADLCNRRGAVSQKRQREIGRKIAEVFRLPIA